MTRRDLIGHPALAPILAIPGALYAGAVAARNALYDRGALRPVRLPCVVVSVGNLTVGGTGKTPVTSFVAALLRESGYRVGVASRGYGRRDAGAARLVSDGRALLCDAATAGDEPYLIARDNPAVPVAVGADRVAAVRLLEGAAAAIGAGLEVVVLDDAFQNRRVARDLDLLLVDGGDPWGNGRMLPRGPLREPLAAVARAHAVVLTRSDGRVAPAVAAVLARFNPNAVVLHCGIEPRAFVRGDGESVGLSSLKGLCAYAFSGIARPERFEAELRALGLRIAGSGRFPDHHRFRRRDLDALALAARAVAAEVLVTTEKDLVRLGPLPAGAPPLYAVALRTAPRDERLRAFILDRLAALRPARRRA